MTLALKKEIVPNQIPMINLKRKNGCADQNNHGNVKKKHVQVMNKPKIKLKSI